MRAPWPMCYGWPSRPGTPAPNRKSRPNRLAAPQPPSRPGRPTWPGRRLWAGRRGSAGAGARGPVTPRAAFLAALATGRAPRAVWSACPARTGRRRSPGPRATAAAAGRGALIVVPDARDLDLIDAALAAVLGPGRHVTLAADLGPAERYRRWLAVRRGTHPGRRRDPGRDVRAGRDLGLVVIWDDGDDLHAEPRAPYPHAREVLALRAHRTGAAALIGGFTRTAEATSLVASGWARPVTAGRPVLRGRAPQIRAAGGDAELARDEAARSARLPSLALRTARDALASGPVLVQVPRRGYLAALGCERCRDRARCAACGGPLGMAHQGAALRCGWCAAADEQWRCARCGHRKCVPWSPAPGGPPRNSAMRSPGSRC